MLTPIQMFDAHSSSPPTLASRADLLVSTWCRSRTFQAARLDAHIGEVQRMLGGRHLKPAAPAAAPKPKQKMNAARRRIAAAQKTRWAEYHRKQAAAGLKARQPAAATKAPRPKRKMSAAGRKRIADATRKRWAEYRRKKAEAAKSAGKPAVMKKAATKGPKKKPVLEAPTQPATTEGVSE